MPLPVSARWQDDVAWLWGVDLFNHRFLWEAHEVWEGAWHQRERGSPAAALLQGMIQSSATLLLTWLGRRAAAERQARAAVRRLVVADAAAERGGVRDMGSFASAVLEVPGGGDWPHLRLGEG